MTEDFPTWLKAMQNGTLGEARTKAFLLDRFWVLERSVDIDGADLIIQRRITSQNLLDRNAPRFGVVQVKFFGSVDTTHYIHPEYVLDQDGAPRNEFFVICHTGTERAPRMFIYSAEDVGVKFKTVPAGSKQAGKYALPGNVVFGDKACEIKDNFLALNRMENALTVADFKKNRNFMSWVLPNAQPDKDAIEPIYREVSSFYSQSIADEFLEMKKSAMKGLASIEEIHHILRGIVEASDPEEAFDYASELEMLCKGEDRWFVSLPRDIQNKDWEEFVREHKKKVVLLKERGILDGFSSLAAELKLHFVSEIYEFVYFKNKRSIQIEVCFDSSDLSVATINSRPIDHCNSIAGNGCENPVSEHSPGNMVFHFQPYGYVDALLSRGESESPEAFFYQHRVKLQTVLDAILEPYLNS